MKLRLWALLCCLVAVVTYSSNSEAGVWGMDPVVGILGDYSTNPSLLDQRGTAVTSGALQLDAPTTYDDGAFKLSVAPSFRFGDSGGYASVTSDYEHLNIKGEFDTERSVLSASAGIARDSSLGYNYLSSGSVGVRRDAATADLNWDRHLTERLEFDADANTQRIRFGHPAGVGTLTDYDYTSIAPTLLWNTTERTKIELTGSAARYDSLDNRDFFGYLISTESRSANLQLGFVGNLSELWSLTALAGYSRALNQSSSNQYCLTFEFGPFCTILVQHGVCVAFAPGCFVPTIVESAQNGSVYAVNLVHQGDRLQLSATASRQLTPTGFAFLSRQSTYELKASYTVSERWSFSGDVRAQQYQNPPVDGEFPEVNVRYLGASANWKWTEHWTVSLAAARITEKVQDSIFDVASNEVTLSLSRQFNHLTFQ